MSFHFRRPFLHDCGKADGDDKDEDDKAHLYSAVVRFLSEYLFVPPARQFQVTNFFLAFSYYFFCASGEAILGTLKHLSQDVLTDFFRAEAISGTLNSLNYFSERFITEYFLVPPVRRC